MKLNYKKVIFVGFAFFLITAFWQAYDSIVPMMLVNKFGLNQTVSGLIMAVDNVLAVFLLPIFGALSDKTKTKFGKRTPYIFVGTILAICMFMGMTFADNGQLNNLYQQKDANSFAVSVWEDNARIKTAENSESIEVQDYAARIFYNKNYSELSVDEKEQLKAKFVEISTDNTITYVYDKDSAVYQIKDNANSSVYTNLFVPARTAYAWGITKANPAPLIIFVVLLFLTLVSMAIFRSPAVALMPDVTVKPLRSKGNAVINLLGTAGGILVLVFGMIFGTGKVTNQMMSYSLYSGAVCLLMALALIIFVFKVKEVKWNQEMLDEQAQMDSEQVVEQEEKDEPKAKLEKGKLISLILILLSVALWYAGYNAVTTKYSLYATNVLGKDYNSTLLIAQAAAIVSYIPVGMIATKIGRKKSILAGVIMLAVAFFSAIFANTKTPIVVMYLVFALAGIGWATINVNSFPMVVELASGSNIGKYTGYYYTASMIAQIVTPVLSGFIMDLVGNMSPLFPYATIFVVGSFITMLFVKHGDSKPQKAKSALESFDNND